MLNPESLYSHLVIYVPVWSRSNLSLSSVGIFDWCLSDVASPFQSFGTWTVYGALGLELWSFIKLGLFIIGCLAIRWYCPCVGSIVYSHKKISFYDEKQNNSQWFGSWILIYMIWFLYVCSLAFYLFCFFCKKIIICRFCLWGYVLYRSYVLHRWFSVSQTHSTFVSYNVNL